MGPSAERDQTEDTNVQLPPVERPKIDLHRCGEEVARDEFSALFDQFSRSALRVEALPQYSVSYEDVRFSAYREGKPLQPFLAEGWHKEIAGYREAGKEIGVIRVVPQPHTLYFRYEMEWGYPYNSKAGQEIRFILQNALPPWAELSSIPDFWMFDESTVAVIKYDAHGKPLGYAVTRDPAEVTQFRALWQGVHAGSISFEEYLKLYRNGLG